MLLIHKILVRIRMRIRIRGSLALTNGFGFVSGSCYFRKRSSNFFAYYFLKVHLHNFSKIKVIKEVTTGSGAGYGSISLTNGSGCGSGRPKNIWILRIRIRNTGLYCVCCSYSNSWRHFVDKLFFCLFVWSARIRGWIRSFLKGAQA